MVCQVTYCLSLYSLTGTSVGVTRWVSEFKVCFRNSNEDGRVWGDGYAEAEDAGVEGRDGEIQRLVRRQMQRNRGRKGQTSLSKYTTAGLLNSYSLINKC